MATSTIQGQIQTYLGAKADSLLGFKSPKICTERLHLPGPDFVDRIWSVSDRSPRVLASLKQAYDMGAVAVGATIYFGSDQSDRQITEVSQAFAHAHELGMATVLWCYLRNSAFKKDKDYHLSADLTGQANHLGVTIQADIIKQKLPENNGGYQALNMGDSSYGKFDKRIYTDLCSDHPIDLTRYQVANCYMGRAGLINSGGASG